MEILSQGEFARALVLERKRSGRSGMPFVLVLLRAAEPLNGPATGEALGKILGALQTATRDTDVKGWFEDGSCLGVIFTEIGEACEKATEILSEKVRNALDSTLGSGQAEELGLSLCVYPETPAERTAEAAGMAGNRAEFTRTA